VDSRYLPEAALRALDTASNIAFGQPAGVPTP
jgi:hypothetical protein